MKRFGMYKHKNNTDVAFMLINYEQDDQYIRANVIWHNLNYGYCMAIAEDNINIKVQELDNWEEYEHQTRSDRVVDK